MLRKDEMEALAGVPYAKPDFLVVGGWHHEELPKDRVTTGLKRKMAAYFDHIASRRPAFKPVFVTESFSGNGHFPGACLLPVVLALRCVHDTQKHATTSVRNTRTRTRVSPTSSHWHDQALNPHTSQAGSTVLTASIRRRRTHGNRIATPSTQTPRFRRRTRREWISRISESTSLSTRPRPRGMASTR